MRLTSSRLRCALRRLTLASLAGALCACAQVALPPMPPLPPAPVAPPADAAVPPPAPLPPIEAVPAPSMPPPAPSMLTGRVVLVLPSQATPFSRAAEAVREGFFAAHKVSSTELTIEVIEIDEAPAQFAGALKAAHDRGARLAVGPLTRGLANAVGAGDIVAPLPLLTLNYPEREVALSPDSLAFGLSLESEARLLVTVALRERAAASTVSASPTAPRFLVLAGETPLARRLAAAFGDELRAAGERAHQFDVRVGYDTIQALTEKVAATGPEAIFLALQAREAAAVRAGLPREVPLYATSFVHLGGAEAALLAPDLEGVRFVDMPWLLEPDHPAVAVFPRSEQPLTGELQRLYALGIDAYRLAVDWLQGRRAFELDGVTGQLRIDRARSARVERRPSFAVFRGGRIERLVTLTTRGP